MEFIKAEEFLGQPVEVQKVFIEWWKPNIGDLFTTKRVYDEIDVIVDTTTDEIYGMNSTFYGNVYNSVDKSLVPFPLLSEGQLRQFIEDKRYVIEISTYDGYEITWSIPERDMPGWLNKKGECSGDNLLDLYWKVAIEIAKEAKS